MVNRKAAVGIYAWRRGTEPTEVGDFRRIGDDFYVTVDADDLRAERQLLYFDAASGGRKGSSMGKDQTRIAADGGEQDRNSGVTEVTKSRHIKDSVRWMLWGKAAGRCGFTGCNRQLWKSPVTQEPVNIEEAAHVYAFSSGGPRGNDGIAEVKLNDIDNLMLACHDCHRKMDQEAPGDRSSTRRPTICVGPVEHGSGTPACPLWRSAE